MASLIPIVGHKMEARTHGRIFAPSNVDLFYFIFNKQDEKSSEKRRKKEEKKQKKKKRKKRRKKKKKPCVYFYPFPIDTVGDASPLLFPLKEKCLCHEKTGWKIMSLFLPDIDRIHIKRELTIAAQTSRNPVQTPTRAGIKRKEKQKKSVASMCANHSVLENNYQSLFMYLLPLSTIRFSLRVVFKTSRVAEAKCIEYSFCICFSPVKRF